MTLERQCLSVSRHVHRTSIPFLFIPLILSIGITTTAGYSSTGKLSYYGSGESESKPLDEPPMVTIRYTGDALWERIERAVEKVKDRMRRVSQALDAASVPYAVVGGNAVQIWVAQVDEAAVRNTRDVDIIINRDSLDDAIRALEPTGFVFQEVAGVAMFLDGPNASPRDAVHIVFAGEKVRPQYLEPAPDVSNYKGPC